MVGRPAADATIAAADACAVPRRPRQPPRRRAVRAVGGDAQAHVATAPPREEARRCGRHEHAPCGRKGHEQRRRAHGPGSDVRAPTGRAMRHECRFHARLSHKSRASGPRHAAMGRRCSERPKPPPDWDGSSITTRICEPPPTAQKSCAFLGIYATASRECESDVARARSCGDLVSRRRCDYAPRPRATLRLLVRSERPTLKLDDVRLNRRWRSDRRRARTASAWRGR